MRWSTFVEMDHSFCDGELMHDVVRVEEGHRLEILSCTKGSADLVCFNPAVHLHFTEL